ncbi:hypothetical protein [Paludisphaera mucosa]|uniref:HEPN domain-containing protein n=1 Tax=Paludisphaera mucosa TaxID=3030827 RepID=A0ABT6FBD6_9BACT|nr:hypothetical protein [Paludisphaera mucosa]MDG3004847.1 hypothetical protein [Paludisphaera mucosa]
MNSHQAAWWEQAQSDLGVLILLRRNSAAPCHQLHYMQMVAEKLAKAYFWRTGTPPPRNHAGLVQFMRSLGGVPMQRRLQLAAALEFHDFGQLQAWIRRVLPMAYELERLAPALAQDGPNPEYPWPHHAPTAYPAGHWFDPWGRMTDTGLGRQFLRVLEMAVHKFPAYT